MWSYCSENLWRKIHTSFKPPFHQDWSEHWEHWGVTGKKTGSLELGGKRFVSIAKEAALGRVQCSHWKCSPLAWEEERCWNKQIFSCGFWRRTKPRTPLLMMCSHSLAVFKAWAAAAVIITHRYFQIRIYGDSHLISNQGNNLLNSHFRGQLLT